MADKYQGLGAWLPQTGDKASITGLVKCRKGHVFEETAHPIKSNEQAVTHDWRSLLGSSWVCQTCLMEWLREEFKLEPVDDPAILAAFKLGGIAAANAVSEAQKINTVAHDVDTMVQGLIDKGVPAKTNMSPELLAKIVKEVMGK